MTRFFPQRWRLLTLALVASLAIAAVAVVVGTPARATTGDPVGLPIPEKKMDVQWGHPLVGRSFVKAVARTAHLQSGVMDVEGITEGEPEWFYGELEMRLYVKGKLTNITESIYPFTHKAGHSVTAELIPAATINEAHPFGVASGHITFTVPKPIRELKTESEEPRYTKASFTLNGKGPYQIEFVRGNDDTPPPAVLPKAKQIGK